MFRLVLCLLFLCPASSYAVTRDRTIEIEVPKQTGVDIYVTFKVTLYGMNWNGSTYQIATHNLTVNINDYNDENVSHTWYDIYIHWAGNWFVTISDDEGHAQSITEGVITTHPFKQVGYPTDATTSISTKLEDFY